MIEPAPPLAILLELTHRCPLQCPYCSNPLALQGARTELGTADWQRVIDEAAALGVLQVHFSGGEPLLRSDLATLVTTASSLSLYSNLITSAVVLSDERLGELAAAGLQHVQISFQSAESQQADQIAGYAGAHERKLDAARRVRAARLALTLNFVVHRQNAERVADMIGLAEQLGATRVEIAHTQYYGWALANRRHLLPSRAQLSRVTEVVEAARQRLLGQLVIDYVVPDYYAIRPKACMGGWARRFINVSPSGRVLPCHAAETLPGLRFPTVRESSLDEIWYRDSAFQKFRGTAWMPEPCRSCEHRETDWGGCRCQAFALTGDSSATDPVCELAPEHGRIAAALLEMDENPGPLIYRR